MSTRYKVRSKVVHETFDDEVIVVNLENGNYFTVADSGAEIWSLVSTGAAVDEIAQALSGMYRGEPAVIASAVAGFVAELERELLIMLDEQATGATGSTPAATAPAGTTGAAGAHGDDRPAFEAPVLAKYTDMEQLLVLDPIHDVDESGWPNVAQVPTASEA